MLLHIQHSKLCSRLVALHLAVRMLCIAVRPLLLNCKQLSEVHTSQDKPARLLGMVKTAAEGRVMLEALEAGTAGVVLNTEDPLQVPHMHRQTAGVIRTSVIQHDCMDALTSL